MNRSKYLMIVAIPLFGLVLWHSFSFGQEWGERTPGNYYQPKGWNAFQASWMIGTRVYSPAGGFLGLIRDLMIDKSNGDIVLVILSDVPDFKDRFVAAPFGALERM